MISEKAQRSAKSLLSGAAPSQVDGASAAASDRASPRPHELAVAIKAHPRSRSSPLDTHQGAQPDKDTGFSQSAPGCALETAEGSPAVEEALQYGGISIVELRRSCIVLLTAIIARQR